MYCPLKISLIFRGHKAFHKAFKSRDPSYRPVIVIAQPVCLTVSCEKNGGEQKCAYAGFTPLFKPPLRFNG